MLKKVGTNLAQWLAQVRRKKELHRNVGGGGARSDLLFFPFQQQQQPVSSYQALTPRPSITVCHRKLGSRAIPRLSLQSTEPGKFPSTIFRSLVTLIIQSSLLKRKVLRNFMDFLSHFQIKQHVTMCNRTLINSHVALSKY